MATLSATSVVAGRARSDTGTPIDVPIPLSFR
jgi:hypothetical protein